MVVSTRIGLSVLLIGFFVFCHFSNCQAKETPPFKKGTDTASINKLMISAKLQFDNDSAINKLNIVIQKCVEGEFALGASVAYRLLGARYSASGNYQKGFSDYEIAVDYAKKAGSNSELALCHMAIGTNYCYQGNYEKGSEEFFNSLDELGNVNNCNILTVASIYVNLANIYSNSRTSQKDKIFLYANKAEALARSADFPADVADIYIANVYNIKANYFTSSHQVDSAIGYCYAVLDIAKKVDAKLEGDRIHLISLAESNIGSLFNEKGEYEKALPYLYHALLLEGESDAYAFAATSYSLGHALSHLKKYKEAETILVTALKKCTANNTRDEIYEGYTILAEVYKATKNYKKAVDCMDSLIVIKDTLMNAEKVGVISQMELKYNTSEKDRQIARNELQVARQNNKITTKNIWIGSISAGAIILAIFSLGLYRSTRQKQQSVVKSLKQENTIGVLKAIVKGEENERTRIAKELHDGIGSMLSATKMSFSALRHDNEELKKSAKYIEVMGLLDSIADEIRKTSHNLMPEALLRQNLTDALSNYCNSMQTEALKINFQSLGSFQNLSAEFKLNVYRIVQELVKNVVEHASATQCMVQLIIHQQFLTIMVEDNGTGFDTNETKAGIGLHNLKTRVVSYDGNYKLKSEIGRGTTINVEFEILAST